MPSNNRPILNPVLSLKRDPRRTAVTGRSQTEENVRIDRLNTQRNILSSQLRELSRSTRQTHADQMLIAVRMFEDSLAPTHEPKSIFRDALGSQLVAPIPNGYLVQIRVDALEKLAALVSDSDRVEVRVSVSRIKSIGTINSSDVMGGNDVEALWDEAVDADSGKVFTVWLAPYFDVTARESVVTSLLALERNRGILPLNNTVVISREQEMDSDRLRIQEAAIDNSLMRAVREYRQHPFTRMQLAINKKRSLLMLVASGHIFRIDPVRPLIVAEVPTAPDPERPVLNERWQPIVGVIDGGLSARSYESMVAWRSPPLVPDGIADSAHGNRVGSLVVHGGSWNMHLDLPDLTCRIGVGQAIAKHGYGSTSRPDFHSYLRSVISRYSNETKVWNLSFSEPVNAMARSEMSELGHQIHKIAREFNVLPVIAIGNVSPKNNGRLCPPSDCEAALTVGGRMANGAEPGDPCLICLPGPGPEGLKKPELSWFSTLRGLGGSPETGSSYATAITSALAAHAFHNLKAPTPDLIRALLINTADRDAYDSRLGWGSPYRQNSLPWECAEGSVTLVWTSHLQAGQWYYWEDIPIPPELIHDGKLRGRVALTAILNPLVSELGSANYFSTRLQVALQYTKANGTMGNLAGTMREDIESEQQARAEHSKWNPIRHHVADIKRGRTFSGNTLRVCARVFGRDLYQHGFTSNVEIEPSPVAFALTLSTPASSAITSSIYNSVATRLGTYVESAVNNIEVGIEQ